MKIQYNNLVFNNENVNKWEHYFLSKFDALVQLIGISPRKASFFWSLYIRNVFLDYLPLTHAERSNFP